MVFTYKQNFFPVFVIIFNFISPTHPPPTSSYKRFFPVFVIIFYFIFPPNFLLQKIFPVFVIIFYFIFPLNFLPPPTPSPATN